MTVDTLTRPALDLEVVTQFLYAEARALDLPFITEVVLAEIEALVRGAGVGPLHAPATVPFFDNRGPEPRFVQLS